MRGERVDTDEGGGVNTNGRSTVAQHVVTAASQHLGPPTPNASDLIGPLGPERLAASLRHHVGDLEEAPPPSTNYSHQMPTVRFHEAARALLGRAGEWLNRDEPGNAQLIAYLTEGGPNLSGYTAEVDDQLVGVALANREFGFLTEMPLDVVPELVHAWRPVDPGLRGVRGPRDVVKAFTDAWEGSWRVHLELRLHRLTDVNPLPTPRGLLRRAERADLDQLEGWFDGFGEEALGVPNIPARRMAESRTAAGTLWVWDADGPVSMAGTAGSTRNGIRINAVYTPPKRRGEGFATACVAAVSAHELASGRRFVTLFTDATNPTSNRIYARIGYVHVSDRLAMDRVG